MTILWSILLIASASSLFAMVYMWFIKPAILRHGDYKQAFEGGLKVKHKKMQDRYEESSPLMKEARSQLQEWADDETREIMAEALKQAETDTGVRE